LHHETKTTIEESIAASLEEKMGSPTQLLMFDDPRPPNRERTSSTFVDNMSLPVHRWFRFSAGFSAEWAESVIAEVAPSAGDIVLDPFAGSGTTLLAAEKRGAQCFGIEAHPFLCRITRAKLAHRTDPEAFRRLIAKIKKSAIAMRSKPKPYPPLIEKCYESNTLARLDSLRQALEEHADDSPASELAWLTLVGILRKVSHVNTAQWQYVLPRKSKKCPTEPFTGFEDLASIIYRDMMLARAWNGPHAQLLQGDARTCEGVPCKRVNLVLTSPPYPNNYDYADATRLEMSFMREINGWGDLHRAVRKHLVCSCSQHVPPNALRLSEVLESPELMPIHGEITKVCRELAKVRLSRGGKKTYHLMVASYFLDLSRVWKALRAVTASPSTACFVIGDSAPYGVYVPVIEWLGQLAVAAGFKAFRFERTRDRNTKWKNRKHRVPLCEGRLWVEG
jgi:hypothetical protein